MAKRKKSVYTWEDVGGVTPEPIQPYNAFRSEYSSPRQQSLVEMFPDVISPIKGFTPPKNNSFKTPEDMAMDEFKIRQQPYSQRASNFITNQLLKANLHNTGIGEVATELGTPIVSGLMRTGGSKNLGETALGVAGATFGTLMSPFTMIKMGTEKVGGETAGKIAEVGSLAIGGGLPMVAGYIASNGVGAVTEEVTKALNLDPKDAETIQEVTGLVSFIAGVKGAEKFGRKINTELGKKVTKWLDESIPEKMNDSVFRKGEGEAVPEGTYKDLLKGQDQQRVINNPPEKRAYQEPTEILPQVELVKDAPSALVFNEKQIKDRINEIDTEVRKAEIEGNESLYNELQAEKKKWQDQLPEIKQDVVETPEIITTKEPPLSKREQQKQTLYDENKAVINKILDENKGLLDERQISAKLNALIDQGKLKKKVSAESIKQIKKEWKDSQPKPEKQVIKSTPNELGLKIPNEYNDKTVFNYGKNAPETLKNYLEKNPEVVEKVKDLNTFEEVSDVIRNDWNQKSEGVLSGKKEQADKNQPAKNLLEQVSKEPETGSVWDEIFGKDKTLEERHQESLARRRKNLGNLSSNPVANLELTKDILISGAYHFSKGAKSLAEFSKRMVDEYGEEIRPRLRELFVDVKNNVKSDDTKITEYLGNPKLQQELGFTIKEVGGKIIDPNTGQEGAARHKAGRDKSVIEINENTQGETYYHEFAHVVNNYMRRNNPNFLDEFKGEIDKLVPKESLGKPINEKFAEAFTEIFTNPEAPRTRLGNVLEKALQIPKSYELARRTNKELGFEKLPERESGEKVKHGLEWLEQKYDAPVDVVKSVSEMKETELYKELRDDGTKKFAETLAESERYPEITKEKLLTLDPNFIMEKPFNDAQQTRIDRILISDNLELVELAKTYKDNLSRGNAIEFDKRVRENIMLQAIYDNNGRELARALASRRRANRLSPEEYQLIQETINQTGKELGTGTPSIRQKNKKGKKITNPTLKDKLQYGWYNLALSNPLTDVANLGGNISSLASVMLSHPISSMKAFKRAYIDGLAFENAKKILKGEQHTISKYTEESATKRDIINLKSKTGNILKNSLLPTERLKVEDALFRTFFEELAKEKTAKIRAKELGVDKKDVIKVYNDLITNKGSIDKLVTEWGNEKFIKDVEGVERWASKMVFQEPLGKTGRYAQQFLNSIFPLNLLTIPFLRIAVNMGKMGLDASPYGLAKLLGRKAKQHFGKDVKEMTDFERKDLFQRAIMGSAFYGALTAILQDGTIELTGEAPKDKNIRELWEKAGYQENSFIINNKDGSKTNVSFNNVTPFNVILGGIGSLMTKAKYDKKQDKSAPADALDIVLGMANALGNQSFLQRSSQLLDIINEGNGLKLETFLYQAVPAPSALGLIKGSTDLEAIGIGEAPTIYQTKTFGEVVQNRYGVTEGLIPKSDVFGEDKKSGYQRFPIPTKRETDKIAKFMLENQLVIDDPSKPTEGYKEIFTDEEFNRYNKLYRRNFYAGMQQQFELLNKMKENEQYGQIMIEKIVTQIKEQARELAKLKIKEKK